MTGKRLAAAAFLLLLAGALPGCALSPLGTAANLKREGERIDWEFIQAVGGLRVDPPQRNGNVLEVPLVLDLSGRFTITRPPVLRDTGLKCLLIDQNPAGFQSLQVLPDLSLYHDIEISVYGIDEEHRGAPARCDAVYAFLDSRMLGYKIPEVLTYRLWYRDSYFTRHLIAEFKL